LRCLFSLLFFFFFFFFQAEDGIRDLIVTGVQTCALPICFTGLRIGWAAAKGLIQERQLPLIAIPSLLGAAHAAAVESVAVCYDRSEERRVGKECRSRWSGDH